jgi:hypothetical protein
MSVKTYATKAEWRVACLAAAQGVFSAQTERDLAEARLSAAVQEHDELLDNPPAEPRSDSSVVGTDIESPAAVAPTVAIVSPPAAAIPAVPPRPVGGINASAVPSKSSGYSARVAVLVFFGAQNVPVMQEQAVNLFAKSGYVAGTIRQAMYDLTSSKHKTLDRTPTGLQLNTAGREFLQDMRGGSAEGELL